MGEHFDGLSELEKAAVAWKVELNVEDQLSKGGNAIYARNNGEELRETLKESIASKPEAVVQLVETYKHALTQSAKIGSRVGKEIF